MICSVKAIHDFSERRDPIHQRTSSTTTILPPYYTKPQSHPPTHAKNVYNNLPTNPIEVSPYRRRYGTTSRNILTQSPSSAQRFWRVVNSTIRLAAEHNLDPIQVGETTSLCQIHLVSSQRVDTRTALYRETEAFRHRWR